MLSSGSDLSDGVSSDVEGLDMIGGDGESIHLIVGCRRPSIR